MTHKARESGYYWVKNKYGTWLIAEFVSEREEPHWLQMGSRLEIIENEHSWREIIETRIQRD